MKENAAGVFHAGSILFEEERIADRYVLAMRDPRSCFSSSSSGRSVAALLSVCVGACRRLYTHPQRDALSGAIAQVYTVLARMVGSLRVWHSAPVDVAEWRCPRDDAARNHQVLLEVTLLHPVDPWPSRILPVPEVPHLLYWQVMIQNLLFLEALRGELADLSDMSQGPARPTSLFVLLSQAWKASPRLEEGHGLAFEEAEDKRSWATLERGCFSYEPLKRESPSLSLGWLLWARWKSLLAYALKGQICVPSRPMESSIQGR